MRYIDVSHHNTITDYNAVSKEVDGAFVRLSYGANGVDKKGIEYAEGLHAAGVSVGLYFYSYAKEAEGAQAEIDNFFKELSLLSFTPELPLVIDMEDADGKKQDMLYGEMVLICEYACAKIEEKGYYAMIYASDSWFSHQLNNPRLDRFDKWIARWGKNEPVNQYGIWQYTNTGKIRGITGNVDISISTKNYKDICFDVFQRSLHNTLDRGNLIVGDLVKVETLVDYNHIRNAPWVLNSVFRVLSIKGDRVVIGNKDSGELTGVWKMQDLQRV